MTKPPPPMPVDRRSQRTRMALRGALVELMVERPWDDIAVGDVCTRANVGRSTFYLHYPNKGALLKGGLEGLQAELRHQARAHPGAGFRFAQGLIEHAHDQRRLFRSLIGRQSGYVVQQQYREMVIRLVDEELPPSTVGLPRPAVARWLAGAFDELLSWWIEEREPMPPGDLAAWFDQLSRPALNEPPLAPDRLRPDFIPR